MHWRGFDCHEIRCIGEGLIVMKLDALARVRSILLGPFRSISSLQAKPSWQREAEAEAAAAVAANASASIVPVEMNSYA